MSESNPLEVSQQHGLRFLIWAVVLAAPLPALAAWQIGNPPLEEAGASALLAILAILARAGSPQIARVAVSVALMGQVMILTAALAGHPWQMDSHMVYFAALACLVLIFDPIALIVAAAVVAVQHLSLSVLLPQLIYPSATLFENLLRTAFHGTVVVMESAALLYVVITRIAQFKRRVAQSEALSETLAQSERDREKMGGTEREQTRMMHALRDALARLAQGDLSAQIKHPFSENFEELRRNYNDAVAALSLAMGNVYEHAESIRADTSSISSAAASLANRTEDQARGLAQVTQTVEQISGFMKSSAEEAQSARTSTDQARKESETGMDVVNRAIEVMNGVERSSNRIRSITDVIEDLAVQTNLLALNAGVEAARAGSAGRGFAVVASEVRALAQRSSEAAHQITELIEESGQQVQSGVKMVGEAGSVFSGVLSSVRVVSDTMQNIADSVTEHSAGIGQIRNTMSELDNLTQQNAAMFEETSAASSALNSATDQLSRVISQFVGQSSENGDWSTNRPDDDDGYVAA